MMQSYLDNPLDLRFVRRYNDSSGILLYMVYVDVGGLLAGKETLSSRYEGKDYVFEGIDIIGFKREKGCYTYYIEFQEVRYDYVEGDGDETNARGDAIGGTVLSPVGGESTAP